MTGYRVTEIVDGWTPTTTRPKRSLLTLCRCGVTFETFKARYEKDMDCWLLRGQRVIFGNREVADAWKKARR